MKLNSVKSYIVQLFALAVMVFSAGCGDDVTNNYYEQPETETPEEPVAEPEHQPGKWIDNIISRCYYGLIETNNYSLFPGWILQANGVRKLGELEDSRFINDFVTEDLQIKLKNPGVGTRITIIADDSDISKSSSMDYIVPADETGDKLVLDLPVNWDYETLLGWHNDRMVKMSWTLLFDGQKVEEYNTTFNCRSLRCYNGLLYFEKETEWDKDVINRIRQYDFNDYLIREDDKSIQISNILFIMGYIDENSPLIEQMKREIVDDGLLPSLPSIGGGGDPQYYIQCSSYAFTYLMEKYNITYTIRQASDFQYVRTIDEIFKDKQGYCMEFAIAFASWCMNQGIICTLESVPAHMVNRIALPIEGDNLYPVDMTILSSWKMDMSQFQIPLTEQNKLSFKEFYDQFIDKSVADNKKYEEGRQSGSLDYETFNPSSFRPFLPSFNIGKSYVNSRATAPVKEIKAVTNKLWKEMALKDIEK